MKAKRIARTIFELKSHAVMGGTLMKDYADVIVSESLDDLKELGRLAEIGRATEFAMLDGSKYSVFNKDLRPLTFQATIFIIFINIMKITFKSNYI